MKHPLQIILWMAMVLTLASDCLAETFPPVSGTLSPGPAEPGTVHSTTPAPATAAESKKDWHLDMGGSYSSLNNNYGSWKGADVRLMYSGLKRITPIFAIASQSRNEGSQSAYGIGSYIFVNPQFYMIAGISIAPVSDPKVVLFPERRMDLTGFIGVPQVPGFVLTTGITDISSPGGGGNMYSLGGIYYYSKAIFSGSFSYNISRPGNVTSQSGQVGIMYGTQGKYWIGGGGGMGTVAYQVASEVPFDARFNSRSVNVFYQRWIGKDWGITGRYDFQDLVDAYQLHGVSMRFFVDF